jgi:hypothetical protein
MLFACCCNGGGGSRPLHLADNETQVFPSKKWAALYIPARSFLTYVATVFKSFKRPLRRVPVHFALSVGVITRVARGPPVAFLRLSTKKWMKLTMYRRKKVLGRAR